MHSADKYNEANKVNQTAREIQDNGLRALRQDSFDLHFNTRLLATHTCFLRSRCSADESEAAAKCRPESTLEWC